jgi:hypothetical protein
LLNFRIAYSPPIGDIKGLSHIIGHAPIFSHPVEERERLDDVLVLVVHEDDRRPHGEIPLRLHRERSVRVLKAAALEVHVHEHAIGEEVPAHV